MRVFLDLYNQKQVEISMVVQWVRLLAPNAGALDSVPDQGSKFHMP